MEKGFSLFYLLLTSSFFEAANAVTSASGSPVLQHQDWRPLTEPQLSLHNSVVVAQRESATAADPLASGGSDSKAAATKRSAATSAKETKSAVAAAAAATTTSPVENGAIGASMDRCDMASWICPAPPGLKHRRTWAVSLTLRVAGAMADFGAAALDDVKATVAATVGAAVKDVQHTIAATTILGSEGGGGGADTAGAQIVVRVGATGRAIAASMLSEIAPLITSPTQASTWLALEVVTVPSVVANEAAASGEGVVDTIVGNAPPPPASSDAVEQAPPLDWHEYYAAWSSISALHLVWVLPVMAFLVVTCCVTWWASSARDIGEERDHEVMSAAEAKAVAAAGGGGGGVIVIDEKDMGAVRRGGGGGGGGGEDKGLALDVEGAGLTRRRLV